MSLLTLTLASCATTPTRMAVALPNGYYLQPDKDNQSQIVKRGGRIVLPGPIAAYAVTGYIVAGALGKSPPPGHVYADLPYTGSPNSRYFVLDTASGKLESDLDGTEWHARLKDLGAPADFAIYPPLPWPQ